MSWHDLLFAHWPLPVDALRRVVPPTLPLDTFAGEAWVGVVPFRMRNVGPRHLPSLPWISAFAELNVRTYVSRDGRPGVYFFSLDAANPVAVAIARRAFRLPYFRARMQVRAEGPGVRYRSTRTHRGAPPAEFRARYAPTGAPRPAVAGSLEHWLSERYCLYTIGADGRPYRGDIHHHPWPLQPAEAEISRTTMLECHGLATPARPPLLHFARRLDVIAWRLVAADAAPPDEPARETDRADPPAGWMP